MKLKISPLIIPIIIAAIITHRTGALVAAYAVMAAHECAHLIAALCVGLRAESITLAPFGVHLKLKNKIVRSLSDEIIVYAAGPLLNGAFALAALVAGHEMLYRMNTVLMVMNLLPVMPLDGGVIMKRIMSYKAGRRAAERIMRILSVILSALFALAALLSLYFGVINPSMFIMSLFLLGNLLTARELYNVELINALTGERKRTNRARLVIIDDSHTISEAADIISPAYTTIAVRLSADGQITELMSERELCQNNKCNKNVIK